MKILLATFALLTSLSVMASPTITIKDQTTLSDVYVNVFAEYHTKTSRVSDLWKWYKPSRFPVIQKILNQQPYTTVVVDFYRADHVTTNNCRIPLHGDVTAKITLTQDQDKNLHCFIETS